MKLKADIYNLDLHKFFIYRQFSLDFFIQGTKKLGAFTVKPETGDDITTGSLFAKKKIEPVEKPAPTGIELRRG